MPRKYQRKSAYATAMQVASTAYKMYPYVNKALRSYNRPSPITLRQAKSRLRKPSYRKRSYKKRPRRNNLSKRVSTLSKIANSDMGNHIYRTRESGAITTSLEKQSKFVASGFFSINSKLKLEDAISGLKYYDPSNPATLVVADGSAGSFHKDFYFKRSYSKLTLRNNYLVPVHVNIYLYKVKESTSITVQTAFEQGIQDVGLVAADSVSQLVYPSDSPQLTDLYKTEKSISKYLKAGQEITMISSSKSFNLDPSLLDDHTSQYQKSLHAGSFGVRISGPLGHDNAAAEIGNLRCAVDYQVDNTFEIVYSAGADIKTVEYVDNTDTFTNLGVTSLQPLADNQFWSQS